MPQPDNPLWRSRYRISAAFRTASERIQDLHSLPVHESSEVLSLLNAADPLVRDKLGMLLSVVAVKSEGPGKFVEFDCSHDHPLIYARDGEEAKFLLHSLEHRAWVEPRADITLNTPENLYRLTVVGWSELAERERRGAESINAFIAISFDPAMVAASDAIADAIASTGHKPIRMDRVEHSNRIDDEILARLRSSRFLVVDLTTQNPGAYFEAGFLLGLGRSVIWVCSKADIENVHFDTRQYNIIDYDDPGELSKRLKSRIEATIGRADPAAAR